MLNNRIGFGEIPNYRTFKYPNGWKIRQLMWIYTVQSVRCTVVGVGERPDVRVYRRFVSLIKF